MPAIYIASQEIIPEHKLAKRYYKLSLDARKIEDEVRVNPDSPMYPLVVSLKRLAKQYMKKGFKKNNELLIKKSIKYWLSILRLFPRNEEANLNLLKCYAKINRELYKAYIKSLLDKARKYIKNKDIIRAKDTLRIVEKFEPNNPLVKKYLHKIKKQKEIVEKPKVPKELISKRYRMGILAYQRGDLQTALKHFRWIVSVEPNNVLASSNLAKVEALLGIKKKKQQKELPLEKKLLVKRLFNQAVRYYIAGKYRLAKTTWEKVLKIYPQHQPSIQSLRKVKALLGG
jgi:tetratricopeptide (TPR) repeat protein